LIVTLSNLSTFDPNDAPDILTGIFFKINGDPKLTPVSAHLGTGSSVIGHALPSSFDGDVGGEWAYRGDLVKAPGDAGGVEDGISATNLKWFGNKKYNFPGPNLEGGKSVGGIDFGLTSLADLPKNDKGEIKNKGLIQNTVVFTFTMPVGIALSDVTDVTFQYGKSLKSAEEITGEQLALVPEPSTIMLVAAGFAGAVAFGRRKITRR